MEQLWLLLVLLLMGVYMGYLIINNMVSSDFYLIVGCLALIGILFRRLERLSGGMTDSIHNKSGADHQVSGDGIVNKRSLEVERIEVLKEEPREAGIQRSPISIQTDLESLERLGKLHANGALTDEEFRKQKEKILGN